MLISATNAIAATAAAISAANAAAAAAAAAEANTSNQINSTTANTSNSSGNKSMESGNNSGNNNMSNDTTEVPGGKVANVNVMAVGAASTDAVATVAGIGSCVTGSVSVGGASAAAGEKGTSGNVTAASHVVAPLNINDPRHWSKHDRYDTDTLLENAYKKHLSRHANK